MEFADTLSQYREALIAKGFKRSEAVQLCRDYQELRFIPVDIAVAKPDDEPPHPSP